jgi:predicted DNA-binding transcriptional regulator AlpA
MAVLEMVKKRAASVPEGSQRAAVSVSEMASLCQLSRSRFHTLVREGIFPPAVHPGDGKRPYYTQELIQQCLDIRRTGIGQNGQVVLFNRRTGKKAERKRPAARPASGEYAWLVESLRGLKLLVTEEVAAAAVQAVFPGGIEGLEQIEVVRKVFLHLQGRRG